MSVCRQVRRLRRQCDGTRATCRVQSISVRGRGIDIRVIFTPIVTVHVMKSLRVMVVLVSARDVVPLIFHRIGFALVHLRRKNGDNVRRIVVVWRVRVVPMTCVGQVSVCVAIRVMVVCVRLVQNRGSGRCDIGFIAVADDRVGGSAFDDLIDRKRLMPFLTRGNNSTNHDKDRKRHQQYHNKRIEQHTDGEYEYIIQIYNIVSGRELPRFYTRVL